MKTKHRLMGVGLLVLAFVLVRFVPWRGLSVAPGKDAAVAPADLARATITGGAAAPVEKPAPAPLAIGHGVSRLDPEVALIGLSKLLEACSPEQRQVEIRKFVAGLGVTDLEKLLMDDGKGDANQTPVLPEDVSQAMLRRLAREDAPWTADFLADVPESLFRGELLGTVMVEWGGKDLSAAVGWARQLTDPVLQETALVHLSYRWYATDPESALAFAALRPTEHRQLLTTLVGQWSREQPETAAAWAADVFKDEDQAGVTASAVAAWASQDELAAAEFVLRLPEGRLRTEAAISVMSALAQKDPELGTRWVDVFSAGHYRNYAIENLVYGWAVSDPRSALVWANRLASAERDTAIFAGAGGLIETRPEVAATWVMTIEDEARRTQQSERVARRWLQTDRPSAELWIRNSPLPPETKQLLLATATNGG